MRYHEITDQINEAFAPAVKWRWTERQDFSFAAIFRIGKVTYEVSCFRFDSTTDSWVLDFTAATKKEDFGHQVSNTGNAWKVFGTVVAIAKQFLVLKKPKMLKIESDLTERSRLAVNRRERHTRPEERPIDSIECLDCPRQMRVQAEMLHPRWMSDIVQQSIKEWDRQVMMGVLYLKGGAGVASLSHKIQAAKRA